MTGGDFSIVSVNLSDRKGVKKRPVDKGRLVENFGLEGDAHGGDWHRQVSLLADEDIDTLRDRMPELDPGDFAENITTRGVDLASLPLGARLRLGDAELEITQIGKECHHGCAIKQTTGDCVMPRRGLFARVIRGGEIDRGSRCRYELSREPT